MRDTWTAAATIFTLKDFIKFILSPARTFCLCLSEGSLIIFIRQINSFVCIHVRVSP